MEHFVQHFVDFIVAALLSLMIVSGWIALLVELAP